MRPYDYYRGLVWLQGGPWSTVYAHTRLGMRLHVAYYGYRNEWRQYIQQAKALNLYPAHGPNYWEFHEIEDADAYRAALAAYQAETKSI